MRMVLLVLGVIASGAWGDALEMRVMSFNIRYGTANDGGNSWAHRRGMVVDLIDESGMDVVGVQEALRFQLDEIGTGAPEYAEIGVGRDDGHAGGEYSAILYRHDRFGVAECGTFWLSDTPRVAGSTSWGNAIPRVCTWARLIEKESGRDVLVYNTHFDHRSQASRERSAELIAMHIRNMRREHGEDVPIVLMGDFNAGEDNAAIEYLLGARESASGAADAPASPALVDSFRAVHPEEEDVATFSRFRTDVMRGAKIDHVLVDDGAEVREAGIDRRGEEGRSPSDHYPVWAAVVW